MIEFFNNKYEIVKGEKYFDKELVDTLLTDYFEPYDYIFGYVNIDKENGEELEVSIIVNGIAYPFTFKL